MSDQTHNFLFQFFGLNAVYLKINVEPQELSEFLKIAKDLPFGGFSVTMPLKEQIVPLIHSDPSTEKIKAINTLVFDHNNKHYVGFNTDGVGALNAIEKKIKVSQKHFVVIGTGGAARSIIFEALARGAKVTIVHRNNEKAKNLADYFDCQFAGLEDFSKNCQYDILVNCLPVEPPIPEQSILPHKVIMDIRSKPKMTLFLEKALKKNCILIYGYEMFAIQATNQFNLWFPKNKFNNLSQIIESKCLEIL